MQTTWYMFLVLTFTTTLTSATWNCGTVEIANNATCECGTWPTPGTYNWTTGRFEQRGEPRILFAGQWQWYCCPPVVNKTAGEYNCKVDENGNGRCLDIDVDHTADLIQNKACKSGECTSFNDLCGLGTGNSVYCATSVLIMLIPSLLT